MYPERYVRGWLIKPQLNADGGIMVNGRNNPHAIGELMISDGFAQAFPELIHAAYQHEDITSMPEVNPTAVIADCIEKSKATADQELIADYITEALGVLQIGWRELPDLATIRPLYQD